MIVLVLIILGLIFGSFVNALIWRVYAQAEVQEKKRPSKKDVEHLKRLSITRGRSMCMSCGHELATKDLIPVISWISLRGKCRYCGTVIPDTPLAELSVPVVFIASYLWWPWALNDSLSWITFAVWLLCAVALVALALYDLKWYILPNRIVFPLIGLSFIFRILLAIESDTPLQALASGFWGVLVLAGLFYLLYIVSNEQWIGGGDVKVAVALGLLSGGPLAAMLLLFVASLSGTLAAVPLIIRGKQARGLKVPFGPFLILATVITVLFASPVLDWYTHLFVG
jgi:leader peptidase (prepilin peptidase)/N-methyltransferase